MKNYRNIKRTLALALVAVMLLNISLVPTPAQAVSGSQAIRSADVSTMNDWQGVFVDPAVQGVALTTENAGGVWTDKSVFLPKDVPAELLNAVSLENTKLNITDKGDNFLVALSAIASNKEITGYSTIPTDTVFVLDMSSSMRTNDDQDGSAIDELAEATNRAITELLELNKNNRVAVVLYAGNEDREFTDADGITQVLLPMDSYTPGTTTGGVGQFLQATTSENQSNWGMRVRSGVKNSSGDNVSGSMGSARGTFMQDGIYEAMRVMLGVTDTTVQAGVQAGTDRLPIMVLMTDGEPTMANNDYDGTQNAQGVHTDLGTSNMYLNFWRDYNHRDTIAFMTQLTAAYAKKQVSAHYGTDALFYTLSYGEEVTRLEEALSVMDPAQTSNTLNGFWNSFLSKTGGAYNRVQVFTGDNNLYVQNNAADPLTAADKLYVDEYFPANSDDELFNAFQSVVDEIIIQSKYYPTYVETDHDHDGYITFTDKIGGYMEVTEIKGFVIGDHFFSGATLSKGFTDENSIFGTVNNPDPRGDELVRSVRARLGIDNLTVARQLLQNAYDHGQLSYTSDTQFSNYIGWYSDKDGNYLDFWHEGLDATIAPANATHIIKSYGFLGQTDQAHGISNTDMLYASVRVSTELNDFDNDGIAGETMLTWQIPASLIPTITYEVSVNVDSTGRITDVTDVKLESENVSPIRLLYEVALREDIKDWNIAEKVNAGYRDSTANKDAGYVFYTNQWNKSADPDETTRNTYSHFEPSAQNERYYYTENSPIYTDQNGTQYTGGSKPAGGTYYRAFKVYEKMEGGTFRIHTHYEQISAAALAQAEQVNGLWVIPKGVIHRFLDDFHVEKDPNTTATMGYSSHPSVVATNEHYYSYSTLGNNGKLTVTPATGIMVTKALSAVVDGASNSFNFQIAGPNGTVTLVRLDAEGNEASRQNLTIANGSAGFALAAGETVYIIGLTDGAIYTVTEQAHDAYNLESVNGSAATKEAVITAVAQTIQNATFVNGPKGYGNLYITKEIVSDHNIPANVQGESFAVTVAMDGLDGQSFRVISSNGSDTRMTVNNGVLELTIHRNETIEIIGLPEGTEVTVTENLTNTQSYFASTIKTRDHTGVAQENNNVAVINRDGNATAVITNTYTPAKTSVDLDVNVTKTFRTSTTPAAPVEFAFVVEQWDGSAWQPITGKTGKVEMSAAGTENVSITDVLAGIEYTTVGSYAYQVREVIPRDNERPDGMIYDRTLYTFTVDVTDVNGQLVATVTDHGDSPIIGIYNVGFTNTYHTAPVSIDIKKTVTNLSGNPQISAAHFGFTLTNADDQWNELPMGAEEVTDAAGEARFADNYENEGIYRYILRENIPQNAVLVTEGKYAGKYLLDGWYWDPAVYYVQVTVEQDSTSGEMTAVVQTSTDKQSFSGSSDSVTLNYTNIYDPADARVDLNIVPTVMKHLEGRQLKDGEFTFYVVKDGTSYTDPANILLTGTNDANGNVTFNKALTISTIGEHKFDVVELVPTDTKGVTYDTTVYDLVVEVEDDGGELTAEYYFEDSVTNQVTFHNTYRAADKTWTLTGEKTMTGRDILNAEFRFDLVQVDDQGTPVQDGLQLTAENGPADNTGKKASFTFPSVTYTHEDIGQTYYYRITEVNGGKTILGVDHDNSQYVVAVEITDNGDGTLGLTQNIVGGNALVFRNTYQPEAASYQIHGLKHLEGRDLKEKEFTFEVYGTDSSYTVKTENLLDTVTHDESGAFSFPVITYNTAGDFYYVVRETKGNVGGVKYDSSIYRIHVNVADDGQGQLSATPEITLVQEENGQTVALPVSSVVFQNVYEIDDQVNIPVGGKKVLEGRELVKGEFKFLLQLADENFVPLADYEAVEAVNQADGSFYFGELTTTAPGIYYLIITEDASAKAAGITYDTTVYRMVIEAKDNGKGGLDCTTKLTVAGKEVKDIVFTNQYKDTSGEGEKPEAQPEPEPVVTPDTGDSAQLVLWAVLLIGSSLTATALVVVDRKKR